MSRSLQCHWRWRTGLAARRRKQVALGATLEQPVAGDRRSRQGAFDCNEENFCSSQTSKQSRRVSVCVRLANRRGSVKSLIDESIQSDVRLNRS
jgi:hypothetical protein